MKKIILLSYYYPPSNFAGSYRIASFAKYLNEYGYYPIVITRHAPDNCGSFRDMANDCGKNIEHRRHPTHEVFYVPYKANLRDRLFYKYGDSRYSTLRKGLTLIELFAQNFLVKFVSYRHLYYFVNEYLRKQKDVKLILASGKPYHLFKLCFKLKKQHEIDWIADYRDEWNTSIISGNRNVSGINKILYKIESYFEKKWLRSSSMIITVSELWAKNLTNFIGINSDVVLNGFDMPIRSINGNSNSKEELIITHIGSLYSNQPIEPFLDAIIEVNKQQKIKVKLNCPGILIDENIQYRLEKYLKYPFFSFTKRIPQKNVADIADESDCFLMVSYHDFEGWISLKFLEYMPYRKPVILCPNNNYSLKKLHEELNLGYQCVDKDDAILKLTELINKKKRNGFLTCNSNTEKIKEYSRENQTRKLASILDRINSQ